jgi:hypothetical protein
METTAVKIINLPVKKINHSRQRMAEQRQRRRKVK